MPVLGQVALRSARGRIWLGAIYALLSLGAVTMVYPFALMVATSFCSESDSDEYRLIPRYLYDDAALYRKYLEAKYAFFVGKWGTIAGTSTLNRVHAGDAPVYQFKDARPPDLGGRRAEQLERLAADWAAFRAEVEASDPGYVRVYFLGRLSLMPSWMIEGEAPSDYRAWVGRRYRHDVAAVNAAYGESLSERGGLWHLMPQTELPWDPSWLPDPADRQYMEWVEWRRQARARLADVFPLEPSFHRMLENAPDLQEEQGDLIGALNRRWGTAYARLSDIPLAATAPANADLRERWRRFVLNNISPQYLRTLPALRPWFVAALRDLYGDVATLNAALGADYADLDAVPMPERAVGAPLELRSALIRAWSTAPDQAGDPLDHIRLDTPELRYRAFLRGRYGTLDAVNAAYGWNAASWDAVKLPAAEVDWLQLQRDKGPFTRWMAFRNYRMVFRFIAGHGYALWNTFVLCLGSVVFTLTINPLCAYALSRYGLRGTNRILIYLLATMAFPAEVAMIPSFLLLRNLDLLNTYWALLLPGAANGFIVFMMKGFFDTLPRELFEAAKIDGATELRMFFQVMLPLCRPVFAYFALGAFTSAYSGFIWAFTICQREDMWTLMVWLYQLTAIQPFSVQMAALATAALPTLLVFAVVQNIILKGIVLPSLH